ncbi:MAG: type I DNA topoisomerase [Salinivirgaceae bacterium]|nr:type I DNA topoisomerase [Salinivirgaceae bacterium]MDY0279845.1 type I DNA topoisomerase [Salinivirgaceae bacterium]
MKNLVIVESPAKAKTIEKFLGKDFTVKSSYGHIRDLAKKNLGIDIEKDFEPNYEVDPDKKKVVAELKESVKKAEMVYLASDEDREGEAIAWHLAQVLKLDNKTSKRIVFHEITQKAIVKAIENPRDIDQHLVNAQQARRILDRIVGFEISPLLWKKIKPSLSAGRVQSVAVRLLVERDREIQAFDSQSSYKTTGHFVYTKDKRDYIIEAELNKRLDENEVNQLLTVSAKHQFSVSDIQTKPAKKSPSAPFTTSTLQQEASRKFGFSVAQTMVVAQRLYESGHITYMRTDSTNLSEDAIADAKSQITKLFGEEYSNVRRYTTKTKGAQEAHEAIRPTYFEHEQISGNAADQRLYELIWKRTLASQMSDAKLEKTNITIPTPEKEYKFVATGEVIKFDGFLKLYIESVEEDDDSKETKNSKILPPIQVGQDLETKLIEAIERFTLHPPRYSEATLVRKLEELGIGRPSTYAPTISTIQQRGYVVKEDRPGNTRQISIIALQNSAIKKSKRAENYGAEKSKLFPTDIGIVVNDYLVEKFDGIMNYGFTANIEKIFDDIADGNVEWQKMIKDFYFPFHDTVTEAAQEKEGKKVGERILGIEPESGKQISVRIGRYGPMAQIGVADDEEKPKFASLRPNQSLESITLKEALDLFAPPKDYGIFEDETITFGIGRFGPYLKHKGLFYSIAKTEDIDLIDHNRAIEIILAKREADAKKVIQRFDEQPELLILNGRYGPYISYQKKNFKIPKTQDPASLTIEQCFELINSQESSKKGKTTRGTKVTKSTTTKPKTTKSTVVKAKTTTKSKKSTDKK